MAKFVCATAVVLAVMTATASALVCYSCNSENSVACRWGLTSFTYNTEECTGVAGGIFDSIGAGAKCYKMIGKNKNGGEEYVARGCMPVGMACTAITMAQSVGWVAQNDLHVACEVCDKEKCNSASKITGFTALGVLLGVLAFLF